MLTVRRRLVSLAAISVAIVVSFASPVGAVAPVMADDDYKWFYWAAPLLGLSLIGMLVAIGIGYYVRVMRPKYRGRQPS